MGVRDRGALPVDLAFLVHAFGAACLVLETGFEEGAALKRDPEKHRDIQEVSAQQFASGFLERDAVGYLFGLQLLLA